MTGFFLCTSYFGIALKLHELSALNPFQYPIGILNRNVRGFLVCVSIMKREGNMASMPFLFDTHGVEVFSGIVWFFLSVLRSIFFILYICFFHRSQGVWEEAEEEAVAGLPLLQPQKSQLLGISLLLLWVPRPGKHLRYVSFSIDFKCTLWYEYRFGRFRAREYLIRKFVWTWRYGQFFKTE